MSVKNVSPKSSSTLREAYPEGGFPYFLLEALYYGFRSDFVSSSGFRADFVSSIYSANLGACNA
jgi:hypothetical protein